MGIDEIQKNMEGHNQSNNKDSNNKVSKTPS